MKQPKETVTEERLRKVEADRFYLIRMLELDKQSMLIERDRLLGVFKDLDFRISIMNERLKRVEDTNNGE